MLRNLGFLLFLGLFPSVASASVPIGEYTCKASRKILFQLHISHLLDEASPSIIDVSMDDDHMATVQIITSSLPQTRPNLEFFPSEKMIGVRLDGKLPVVRYSFQLTSEMGLDFMITGGGFLDHYHCILVNQHTETKPVVLKDIENSNQIETGDFRHLIVTPETKGQITELLKRKAFRNVQILEFTHHSEGVARPLPHVLKALFSLRFLQHLDLNRQELTPAEAEDLAIILQINPELRYLRLFGNRLGDEGISKIAPKLKRLEKLDYLNLAGNEISDSGAHDLAKALHRHRHLRKLIMVGNTVGDEGFLSLLKSFKSLSSQEVHFNFHGNNLTSQSANAFLESKVFETTSSKTINFMFNRITSKLVDKLHALQGIPPTLPQMYDL